MENILLESLNKGQYESATSDAKNTLIIAGAGTGKTHTLISRLVYLADKGINPANILLLTFTNAAANEMKERAANCSEKDFSKLTACTYHSFCAKQLRYYAKAIDLKENFAIIDTSEAEDIIRMYRSEIAGKDKDFPRAATILSLHSSSINTETPISKLFDLNGYDYRLKMLVSQILSNYKKYKKEHALLDYDDLLTNFYTALQNPYVKSSITDTYKYIMVDEFQDSNNLQNKIVDSMLAEDTSLTVVGDDYQSIYKFRGANVENFLNFPNIHNDTKITYLEENYRSDMPILSLANNVMEHQADFGFDKKIISPKEGKMPILIKTISQEDESNDCFNKIKKLLDKGVIPADIAVLYRSTRSARFLEANLKMANIDYNMLGGQKFFELEEVRNLIAFQRVILTPTDESQWFRILQLYPEIGETRGLKIAKECLKPNFLLDTEYEENRTATQKTIYKVLHELDNKIKEFSKIDSPSEQLEIIGGYYEYLLRQRLLDMQDKQNKGKKISQETIDKQEKTIKEFEENILNILIETAKKKSSLSEWLDDLALDNNKTDKDGNKLLTLSTIHSSKGLEWTYVFILDVADGLFPSDKVLIFDEIGDKQRYKEEFAEELRCFYVAITRPKRILCMYEPASYKTFKGLMPTKPCRFLNKSNKFYETQKNYR